MRTPRAFAKQPKSVHVHTPRRLLRCDGKLIAAEEGRLRLPADLAPLLEPPLAWYVGVLVPDVSDPSSEFVLCVRVQVGMGKELVRCQMRIKEKGKEHGGKHSARSRGKA